ncbi:MAG: glycosyltransferase family 4 protein [Bacteroidota bacterium]
MQQLSKKHILIIVENLPVPFDRRVWQEANTLKENGAHVSIICPKMKGYTKSYEVLNGIEIYRHPLPVEASGAIGYLLEYSAALFFELILSFKIFLKKPFHVIHGCNPPDLIFLVCIFYKLFGVKFVFDHHDINPELFIAKFEKKGFFYKLMLFFERSTFFFADYSIATNESYREIAIKRGKMKPSKVQVIRSGPKLDRLRIQEPKDEFKRGKRYLIGYVGVIGEQEGIDLLLDAFKKLIDKSVDVQLAVVGGGTYLDEMKEYAIKLGISDHVDFYGRVSDQELIDVLNTSDICANPDRPTEMNNLSTMNKIMEYMALKKPIVQFDLKEGKFSAQQASLYASDVDDFSEKMYALLKDKELRNQMGEFGYRRVKNELSWEVEEEKLVKFYGQILSK